MSVVKTFASYFSEFCSGTVGRRNQITRLTWKKGRGGDGPLGAVGTLNTSHSMLCSVLGVTNSRPSRSVNGTNFFSVDRRDTGRKE